MSLAGDLRTIDLFDLLAWVVGRRKSGKMTLTRRSTRKTLVFQEGRLRSALSNDPRETLGQALVREGYVDEETLFRALLRQETDDRRLGEILVGDGRLSEEQLLRTLRAGAESQLHELFLWPDGRFELDDTATPDVLPDLAIDLKPVLDEGRHRRELWTQLRQRFPTSEITFRLVGDPKGVVDPTLLTIVELAGRAKTLAAMSLETRRSEYEAALLVAGLCDAGVLAMDQVQQGSPESDPVGTIAALLAVAEMRLNEGRFDAALESYEKVLLLDHVNQQAKVGLLAVAEARQKARAAQRIPLEKVPVIRLTGMALSQQRFTPEEGFVLSRINGQWDVRSILKLCPMPEDDTLYIFARLLDRNVISLR